MRSGCGRELPKYDVSIILNLHDEARYLRRSLLSLEEAVRYARQFDITFEIVVVLDNADQATTSLAQACDYSVFDASQLIHVCNGSLGPSRNDGIRIARGEFIATADADDLVSFDYFQKLYRKIIGSDGCSIVFPEYYFGFGIDYYVWKFWSFDCIGVGTFCERHPYVSRLMFRRDLFEEVQFADVSLRSGYAYEDWHFNCECLAADCSIEVAEGAVLFYRQRAGSLLRRADSETSRLIPRSRFFEPETYLRLTSAEMSGGCALRRPEQPFTPMEFYAMPGMGEIVVAANRIDPTVSLGILDDKGQWGSNLADPGPLAAAYFEACREVAGKSFTDVLLVPFFTKGGAEKYILSVIAGLRELQSETRLLVIAVQKFGNHEWLEKLPEESLFLDFQALGVVELTEAAIETAVFRLVQHLPGLRRLHMKNCEFVDGFARKYASLLNKVDRIFYHFCDPVVTIGKVSFVNGRCFDLLSEAGHHFSHIVSDHRRTIEFVQSRIGRHGHVLYAECPLPERTCRTGPTRKLLWAARIDGQKRPELLTRIAHLLEKEGVDVSLDAYGGTTYGTIGPEIFMGATRLTYKGAYDGFAELPVGDYDGFIYTAAFDGLPNVVLEAMAAELPVIAPDVGGVGEAVTGQTGFLVQDDPDPERLAENFVDAIKTFYGDWQEAMRRGENGRRLIAARHSHAAFLKRVAELFDLKQSDKPRRKPAKKTEPA